MTPPKLNFANPQDLNQLLNSTSCRLHYINRVSGESNFRWHLAEVINAVGKLADLIGDSDTEAAFGNGYTPGTLDRSEQTDQIVALLRARLKP